MAGTNFAASYGRFGKFASATGLFTSSVQQLTGQGFGEKGNWQRNCRWNLLRAKFCLTIDVIERLNIGYYTNHSQKIYNTGCRAARF
ncbi:hypothetical protein C7N43_03700 [Sphingobacteriales bacterium UPWRP_1]|nr:hypothetical protein BVG80_08110 [Sphingobacteriales bacterium TSM_CSM]PSJ78446.1 hypothetical protein C7N43_03700 [Sphingobacteriales bacterium UPWRP_1]